MKIIYGMLLLLISFSSVTAQQISVSYAPSSCSDGGVFVTLTSPGGTVTSGAVWYMVSDSRNSSITTTNPFQITNCFVVNGSVDGGDDGHEFDWDGAETPNELDNPNNYEPTVGPVEWGPEDPDDGVNDFNPTPYEGGGGGDEPARIATTPITCTAGTGQAVQTIFNSNPLYLGYTESGTYKVMCVMPNGVTYYSDYFSVSSNVYTDLPLCGIFSKAIGNNAIPLGQYINAHNSITTCSTGTAIYADLTNPANSGDLHVRAGQFILLTPNFLADYGSDFVAVIGDPCGADNFRVGDFTPTYETVKVSQFSVYPNPTVGSITINIPNEGNYELFVEDLYGQTVYQNKFEASVTKVDLKSLKAGVYYLKALSNGQTYNSRIVIVE